jgi:hypothetical protein
MFGCFLVLGQAVLFPQVFDIHIATQVKMEFDGALRQNRGALTTFKAKTSGAAS